MKGTEPPGASSQKKWFHPLATMGLGSVLGGFRSPLW
jgi:hypothetical protein